MRACRDVCESRQMLHSALPLPPLPSAIHPVPFATCHERPPNTVGARWMPPFTSRAACEAACEAAWSQCAAAYEGLNVVSALWGWLRSGTARTSCCGSACSAASGPRRTSAAAACTSATSATRHACCRSLQHAATGPQDCGVATCRKPRYNMHQRAAGHARASVHLAAARRDRMGCIGRVACCIADSSFVASLHRGSHDALC